VGCRKQVRADPEQFRDSFEGTGSLQYNAVGLLAGEALRQIIEQVGRAFDGHQVHYLQSTGGQLCPQLAGPVRIAAERTRVKWRQVTSTLNGRQLGLGAGDRFIEAQPKDAIHPGSPA